MMVYYRLSASPMQGTKVVDAPAYTSYRSQYVGTGIPDVQMSHTVSGTYSYRNPVYGLYFSINPVFTQSTFKTTFCKDDASLQQNTLKN